VIRLPIRLACALFLLVTATGWNPSPMHAQFSAPAPAGEEILVMFRLSPPHFRGGSSYGGSYGDGIDQGARQRLARRIARDNRLTIVTHWPMPLLGVDCFVMRLASGESSLVTSARLSRDPSVAWSEPMHDYEARGSAAGHNDPLYLAQPAASQWHLAALHHDATGRGVTIAVIDSRIEGQHPDLIGQLAFDQDFVTRHPAVAERHGTAVAGIIAAKADNSIGIAGVAPNARLMGLRACWQQPGAAGVTVCDTLSLARALTFAIEHGAQVINLSLSGPRGVLLGKLLETALRRGATVVAAFDPRMPDGGFPASHPGVIAVSDEKLSSTLPGVYTAPGSGIPTTQLGGRWYLVDGSSFAAAHVSGLMALLRERQNPSVRAFVLVSTRNGGGAIDAYATVLRQAKSCDRSCGVSAAIVSTGK
jgi:Subtilase family